MKVETKVGLLVLTSIALVIGFAYITGFLSPFSNQNELNVMYNYAGGIEVGSPVRVMGIRVGKVTGITFDPSYKTDANEEVKLKISIGINKEAWATIRQDSKFFINLAGVIGEKFLEVSPGSSDSPSLNSGDYVRGEDPPRVDQLISQSYGLAGKMIELISKNEGSATSLIKQVDTLLVNMNKTLVLIDKTTKNQRVAKLMDNAVQISDDLAYLTAHLRTKKSEETFELLRKLLFRLEPLDGPTIRKFLQDEGIRAKVF